MTNPFDISSQNCLLVASWKSKRTHPSLKIGVCSMFNQQPADVVVAVVGCNVQRGESALVIFVFKFQIKFTKLNFQRLIK